MKICGEWDRWSFLKLQLWICRVTSISSSAIVYTRIIVLLWFITTCWERKIIHFIANMSFVYVVLSQEGGKTTSNRMEKSILLWLWFLSVLRVRLLDMNTHTETHRLKWDFCFEMAALIALKSCLEIGDKRVHYLETLMFLHPTWGTLSGALQASRGCREYQKGTLCNWNIIHRGNKSASTSSEDSFISFSSTLNTSRRNAFHTTHISLDFNKKQPWIVNENEWMVNMSGVSADEANKECLKHSGLLQK